MGELTNTILTNTILTNTILTNTILTNTVFVNSTNITTNIETAALSREEADNLGSLPSCSKWPDARLAGSLQEVAGY